jgi:hypothetical protein
MENIMQSDNNTVSIKTDNCNHSKRTVIIRDKEQVNICDTISQEIASFQKKSGIPGLYQSAIIVDVPSLSTSHDVIQECSAHIRQYVPGWDLKILTTKDSTGRPSIFNCISNSSVVRAVAKTGTIKVPSLISKLTGVFVFLTIMILFVIFSSSLMKMIQPTIPVTLMIFCSAAIVGYLIYWIMQNRTILKFAIPSDAIQKITQNNGNVAESFYDAVANEVSGNLPSVIIIEDLSAVDGVSALVVKQILTGNNINSTGAILWVAFDTNPTSSDPIFTNCNFSVKRYLINGNEC